MLVCCYSMVPYVKGILSFSPCYALVEELRVLRCGVIPKLRAKDRRVTVPKRVEHRRSSIDFVATTDRHREKHMNRTLKKYVSYNHAALPLKPYL